MPGRCNPCRQCDLRSCGDAVSKFDDLHRNNNLDECYYTLDYLLYQANDGTGAIGADNATSQDKIVDYINSQLNGNLTVTAWQQHTLQFLKDKGLVATKLSPGGTFIPCMPDDLIRAAQDTIKRIKRELEHAEGYLRHIETYVNR